MSDLIAFISAFVLKNKRFNQNINLYKSWESVYRQKFTRPPYCSLMLFLIKLLKQLERVSDTSWNSLISSHFWRITVKSFFMWTLNNRWQISFTVLWTLIARVKLVYQSLNLYFMLFPVIILSESNILRL